MNAAVPSLEISRSVMLRGWRAWVFSCGPAGDAGCPRHERRLVQVFWNFQSVAYVRRNRAYMHIHSISLSRMHLLPGEAY